MKKITLLLIAVLAAAVLLGAERQDMLKVNSDALTEELQKSAEPTPGMNLVWWVPVEFWKSVLLQDKTIKPEEANKIIKTLEPYTMIAVVRTDIGTFGAFNFHDKATVARNMKVTYIDEKGKKTPVKQARNVNKDALLMLDIMKPILTNAMGNMGKNFHFFVYADRDARGRRVMDPYKKGKLVVELARTRGETGGVIEFECPLNSLFVPRKCLKCKKEAHISWNYCPWCGKPLPK